MKNQDYLKELKLKTIQELTEELKNKRKELFSAKLKLSSGKLKDFKKLGRMRRQTAQLLTIRRLK